MGNVLERDIVLSSSENIWGDVHGVAISESFANKLFGNDDPLNKKFKLNEGWEFFVSAVFKDIPKNSHLAVDVVGSTFTLWYYMRNFDNTRGVLVENPNFSFEAPNIYGGWLWRQHPNYRNYCYIKLAENTSIESVKAQIPAVMKNVQLAPNMADVKLTFNFQPIKDIHLTSNLLAEYKINGDEKRVRYLYLIAIVVLIVSAINYINLSSLQTIESGKHYSVRLLNGAKISSIIKLLTIENITIAFLSIGISVVLIELFSGFLELTNISAINISYVLAVMIAAGIVAGFYSYFTALHGKFRSYLKSQSGSLAGNMNGRQIFVVLQFCIAIILISGTVLINKQLQYMIKYDLGFKPEQTMFSYSPMSMNMRPDIPSKLATFKSKVLALPGVKGFATSSSIPGKEITRSINGIRLENLEEPVAENFSIISSTEDYTRLFDLEFIAGNAFTPKPEWVSNEVIINNLAAQKMGFNHAQEAVGEIIRYNNTNRRIVGVINNYHHESLKKALQPILIEQNLNWDHAVGYYTIRLDAKSVIRTMMQVKNIWEDIYPLETASFQFTDSNFQRQYESEMRFKRVITVGSLIAIFISCMGLFACALFDTQKRIREIGIRKVNGASIAQIIILLNKNLIMWLMISLMISIPFSWFALKEWLNDFAYRTSLSWWVFALSGTIVFTIAWLTVTLQSWKAARKNPVEALRYE